MRFGRWGVERGYGGGQAENAACLLLNCMLVLFPGSFPSPNLPQPTTSSRLLQRRRAEAGRWLMA